MIKRALIFSLIFTSLVAAAVFFLFNSVALRDIAKRLVVTQARYKLDMKVEVDDIRLSYFRPAVVVEKLKLEKETEKFKLSLSAPRAVVRFNPIQIIRGDVVISGVRLYSPSLYLELVSDGKPVDLKSININSIVAEMLKAKLSGVHIDNANVMVRIMEPDGKSTDISSTRMSVDLKKGIVSNYVLELKAENITSPLKYVSSVELEIDVKKDVVKLDRLIAGIVGGKVSVAGYASDLEDLSQLKLDLFWRMDLNLAESRKYSRLLKWKEEDYPSGAMSGSGRLSGRILHDLNTLSADGNIKVKDFAWFTYRIPQIELTAKYSPGSVTVSKLDVSDGVRSIEVQEAAISLKAPYEIKGKGHVREIELSRYLEMFNLKRCLSYFTIGGPFTFTGSVKPEFKISGLFDLKVSDFWVLKEKGLVPNRKNSVLDFKKGSVNGFVHFSTKGAYFDNFVAKSEDNTMVVSGWITAEGNVDLDVRSDSFSMDTYGRIAELPLKGKGSLTTKLIVDDNGDFKNEGRVQFRDVQILDEYRMGDVDTRIIYDGDNIYFKDIKGKIGSSVYTGYNELDFDRTPGPSIKGYGIVTDGYSEDIYKIFKDSKKLPGSPSGMVNALVKFEGYPTWSTINLESKIRLKDVEFFSERFDEMIANFAWKKGDVSINDLYFTKGKGRVDLKGVRKDDKLKVDISSKGLSLADFMVLSRRNTELSGGISVKGEVEHAKKSTLGQVRFNIFDLVIGGQRLKPVALNLELGQAMNVKFSIFDQEARGEITRQDKNTYVLKSRFSKFNFYPIGSMILKDIENFKTEMDGEAEVVFTDSMAIRSARIRIDSVSLSNSFLSMKNVNQVNIDYLNDKYSIRPFSILTESDNNKCVMNVDNGPNGNIVIRGCATTGVLKLFKGYITAARGKFDLDLSYDTKLSGTVIPKDVEIVTTEHKLGGIGLSGRINLDRNFARFDGLSATTAGANISFTGGLDVDRLVRLKAIYPGARLGVHVDKLFYEYPEGLKGKWTGDINISGNEPPYKISGLLSLFESSYRKDFNLTILGSKRSRQTPALYMAQRKKNMLDLDIKVKSGDDLRVRNNIFDGELVFDLNIKGKETDPKIAGSIDLLRGKVSYMDNEFDLIGGRFKFKEDVGEPAVYQLESESKIKDYLVYLRLVSEKGEPKFKLTSVPPLTEDKILALMATGDVQTDFSEKSGYGMSTGAGGQLVTEGLGMTSSIKEKTGVGFRVKAPSNKDSTLPDIELQKDLTSDIKVIYGKSLDETTNKQEVNVQYEVNRNVQLKLLLEEEVKKENVTQEPTSAGVDVKFKFEF